MTRVPATPTAPRRIVVLLAALSMIGPFTIDTIFPGFAQMGTELAVSEVALQQVISVYMLTFAGASLFHGPLSDAVGRRPVILGGMAAYGIASAVCALAPNLPTLLAGRILQGLVAGAALVVSRTVARDLFPPAAAQRTMAQMSMIFGLAPAIAPVVGGWLLQWTSWRGIFWFLVLYAALALAAAAVFLPESHPVQARTPLRVGALLRALVDAVADPGVRRLALAIALGFGAMFLYISSAPAFVGRLLGLGPQDYWVLFAPMVAMLVLGSWLSGRLAGRVRARRLVVGGMALALIGGALSVFLTAAVGVTTLPAVIVGPMLTSLGVSVVFPVATIAVLDQRPGHRGTVSSVQSATANLSNALVAGLVSPLVSGSFLGLALTSLAFTVVATAFWARHAQVTRGG